MKAAKKTITPYNYQSYRLYLKDWYTEKKLTQRGFSYRAFSQKAGFQTSNFLMLVIQGKRNLTEQSLARMVKGLGLNKQEQEVFRNLVFMNQAKTAEDKTAYYERLMQCKKFTEKQPLQKRQYEYYSQWFNPVIRELITHPEFDGTAEWLSQKLSPPVTATQCARSLELLIALGLIKQTGPKTFIQSTPVLSTGERLVSLVVHNYHKKILDLTRNVMDTLTSDVRDVSSLTLGIKKDRLPELQEKVRTFRKEILNLVSNDTKADDVVQLNIQLFPVTQRKE